MLFVFAIMEETDKKCMRNLDDLIVYINRKYPYPEKTMSKAHMEKRCSEIYAANQLVIKCMDSPYKEPLEVAYDYILTLEFAMRGVDSKAVIKHMNVIISTLNDLYEYLRG